jgi:hypothetical protein
MLTRIGFSDELENIGRTVHFSLPSDIREDQYVYQRIRLLTGKVFLTNAETQWTSTGFGTG